MATAQLYLGNIPIGGDVDASDLAALQGEIDANTAGLSDLTTTVIPDIEQDIVDLVAEDATQQGQIDALDEKVMILSNATVAAKFRLLATPDSPSNGDLYMNDVNDFANVNKMQFADIDAQGNRFLWTDVESGMVIQVGSAAGKGMFTIDGDPRIESGYMEVDVIPTVATDGHAEDEHVGISIGSAVDTDSLMTYIANNAGDIANLDAEVQGIEVRVTAVETEAAAALPKGTSTYTDAQDIQDAVEQNAADISSLATGGNPAVDSLENEAVRNTNMMAPGASDVGVMEIEVVTAMPAYPKDTTLYVVKA